MLDPAILLNLEAPMPPSMPTLVIEREWRSDAGDRVARIAQRYADGYDALADQWIAQVDRLKAEAEAVPALGAATAEEIETLTRLIGDFESLAEDRAVQSRRLTKRVARNVKEAFRSDPGIAAAHRMIGNRLIDTDRRIEVALLDYALFLRAVRAEGDPTSRGGPVFDDPDELAAHLNSLATA